MVLLYVPAKYRAVNALWRGTVSLVLGKSDSVDVVHSHICFRECLFEDGCGVFCVVVARVYGVYSSFLCRVRCSFVREYFVIADYSYSERVGCAFDSENDRHSVVPRENRSLAISMVMSSTLLTIMSASESSFFVCSFVSTPIVFIPALFPAVIPLGASSMTTQCVVRLRLLLLLR